MVSYQVYQSSLPFGWVNDGERIKVTFVLGRGGCFQAGQVFGPLEIRLNDLLTHTIVPG
jgi:hypothetical protein